MMDDAVPTKEAVAVAAAAFSTNFYPLDLVSYRSVRGLANLSTWTCSPADKFQMISAGGTYVTKKAGDTEVTLLDRSHLCTGQVVVPASDVDGGQIGIVTGVTTVVDLVQFKDDIRKEAEATEPVVARGVSPSALQRVGSLSLGDYVVHGPWLGRVVEVSIDVDVVFDDGSVCRVTDAGSKERPFVKRNRAVRHQTPMIFYPGIRVVVASGRSSFFRDARWLKGHRRWLKCHQMEDGEVGTVARVEMSGVLVRWIASAHLGTDQQLVQESAPPAYQDPANLTYFCSDSCSWLVSDRCFLRETVGGEEENESSSSQSRKDPSTSHAALIRKKKRPTHTRKQPAPMSTMTVSNTRTTVDVLWQDGTRQHGAPSTSLVPFFILNTVEFLPGLYVLDAALDITGDDDDVVGVAKGRSTRRIGVVKTVNSKDHTVNVSWFKAASLPDRWEAECDATVSAYDLEIDPDRLVFYGNIVVRLQPQAQQQLAPCNKKGAPFDLSWVGRVVDLHGGHAQVKWGDGSTSTVLPHEISVVNMKHYVDLENEIGNWVEEDWVEEDNVDGPQESGAPDTDNNLHDTSDARNVEGGRLEGGQPSVNGLDGLATTRTGRLGGFIRSMIRAVVQVLRQGTRYPANGSLPVASDLPEITQNVEAPAHTSTGTQEDHSIVGIVMETGHDASVDGDDLAKDVVKAREANGDEDPSNFPHFDAVQSPSDHHYLDSMDQGSSSRKMWVKAVQKEWKILENDLPDTIYVRAFEDRMDLLRVAMVGASRTPYQDGLFFFDLQLPPSYPAVPPQVYYHSFGLRVNPNLYESGTVCLSLLGTFSGEGTEVWSPATSTLLQVLVSIQGLVLNAQPYYNESTYESLAGTPTGLRNSLPYDENAFLLSLRTALQLLRRPPQGFEVLVKDHFRRRGRNVLQMCGAYLQGCVPTEEGAMELPCTAGFRITLGNIVPRLVAAFTEIGVKGRDDPCPLTTAQ